MARGDPSRETAEIRKRKGAKATTKPAGPPERPGLASGPEPTTEPEPPMYSDAKPPEHDDDTDDDTDEDVLPEDLDETPFDERKSLMVAYFLWLMGGIWGAHHMYLKRDKQALLWMWTFGGFYIGYLRDMWRIPTYVAECNYDKPFIKFSREQMEYRQHPPGFFTSVLVGQLLFTGMFRYIALHAVPRYEEDTFAATELILLLVAALATATTVHGIGTMPFCYEGSWKHAFIGAFIGETIERSLLKPDEEWELADVPKLQAQSPLTGIALSILFFRYTRSYRTLAKQQKLKRSKGGVCKRISKIGLKCLFMWVLIFSAVYWNGDIDSPTEEFAKVRIKDSVEQIRNSPAWAQFKQGASIKLTEFYTILSEEGFEAMWNKFTDALDVDGTQRAYVDLELQEGATQEEIKKSARRLQKLYHPDRCTLDKDVCIDKFQAVQSAYEVLSDRAASKKQKNERSSRG